MNLVTLHLGFRILAASTAIVLIAPFSYPAENEEKFHVFVGLNLAVRVHDQTLPVEDVEGGYIVVREAGNLRNVPYYDAVAYRVDTDVKVTELSATVENLTAKRAYTPYADPHRRAMEVHLDVASYQDSLRAQAEQKFISNSLHQSMSTVDSINRAISEGNAKPLDQHASEMNVSLLAAPSIGTGFVENLKQNELAEEQFDAIDLEFTVSTDAALPEPYFVAIAEFRDPARPDEIFNWIHAQEIPELGPNGRKVRVFKGGFPPGYKLEKHRVHIFSRTQELATNSSEKHMTLNADDAHTYMKAQYENGNRGKTVNPKPLWTKLTPQLREQIPAHDFRRVLLLQIDAEGRVTSVAPEDNEYGALDERLVDAVRSFRFYPALEKGRPTPGRLRIQFSELTRRNPRPGLD